MSTKNASDGEDPTRAPVLQTPSKNNSIVRRYNKKEDFYLLDDKVLFNEKFKDFLGRDYLKVDNFDDFKSFTSKHKEFIAKPIDGCGGKGIMKYEVDDNVEELFNVINSLNQKIPD